MEETKPTKSDEELEARKGSPRDWEGVVEKQIREAMERGEFDNLVGRGRPLDLSSPPHIAPEWDLAFKLLRDAGFAPQWIEQDKEIRAAKDAILEPFQKYLKQLKVRRTHRSAAEAGLIADFREQAKALNRLIDDFNLKAPSLRVHHTRIRIEEEIVRFKEEASKGRD